MVSSFIKKTGNVTLKNTFYQFKISSSVQKIFKKPKPPNILTDSLRSPKQAKDWGRVIIRILQKKKFLKPWLNISLNFNHRVG